MGRNYKFHYPDRVYFIWFAVQGWGQVFTLNLERWKDFVFVGQIINRLNFGVKTNVLLTYSISRSFYKNKQQKET